MFHMDLAGVIELLTGIGLIITGFMLVSLLLNAWIAVIVFGCLGACIGLWIMLWEACG